MRRGSATDEGLSFFLGVGLMMILMGVTGSCTDTAWKKEAVEKGHAEYVLDPATGKVTWRWKEGVKEAPKVPL